VNQLEQLILKRLKHKDKSGVNAPLF